MSSIFHIRDHNDQRVDGFDVVAEVMTKFYKVLLGRKKHHRRKVDQQVVELGQYLTIDQQIQLCKPFNDSDIKQALFSISNPKSPGLHGFTSGFCKASWKDIGALVCSAIKGFFSEDEMPTFYGETKLVVLPKIPNCESAKDFRPISCCNVIYKCIKKLLCNILK